MSCRHFAICFGISLLAQDPSVRDERQVALEEQRAAEALTLTTEAARRYQFTRNDAPSAKLEMVAKPVLRWSNPERGSIYGNVFLWRAGGRPEVVGSLFKWYSPFTHASHEFQSLSQSTFNATLDGQTVWQPSGAGVEFKAVPDAPPPADSPVQRLTQMRTIARQFNARATDREKGTRELRLLTQPIHRCQGNDSALLDGTLFVFVQGTDPELFLLLEARKTRDGLQYHYAAARMNSIELVLRHNDRDVWRADTLPWREVYDHRGPYTSFKFD